ncbi:conserved hypothetical protein [Luminiphilus syltensis NOR5-1B]|uniref:ChsH2 C-terminal OB-fold domain-containing protein n=2 Tax=Luminiphilus TaxID=1341118 RepID=B8KUI2_9GAMM|nr:conserved hypothetical protein [Luminiphilus syltensis NOR5-1B]
MTYFPSSTTCRNPACGSDTVESTQLSLVGTLYSYTVQHYQPPPLFRNDDWQPYAIGVVEFPEKVRVMGMLSGIALDDIAIGERYVLALSDLVKDADGKQVHTHAFTPESQGTPSE